MAMSDKEKEAILISIVSRGAASDVKLTMLLADMQSLLDKYGVDESTCLFPDLIKRYS